MATATKLAPLPLTDADRRRAAAFKLTLPPAPTPEPKAEAPAKPATVNACRLTLSISGASYDIRPAKAECFGGLKAWRLKKSGAQTPHYVAETVHGATCDCGDQTWRREGIDPQGCKHIRALRALGLIG